MTVKELKRLLANYTDEMEVVLFRQAREDYGEYYDNDFYVEINDNAQLVID